MLNKIVLSCSQQWAVRLQPPFWSQNLCVNLQSVWNRFHSYGKRSRLKQLLKWIVSWSSFVVKTFYLLAKKTSKNSQFGTRLAIPFWTLLNKNCVNEVFFCSKSESITWVLKRQKLQQVLRNIFKLVAARLLHSLFDTLKIV